MKNSIILLVLLAFAILAISSAAHGDHHHGGGGGGHHDHGSHHHHHGGDGGSHHHHPHHWGGSSYSSSNYHSSDYYGGGGFGLGRLLFGGLFRRPTYSYYPSYYGYGNYNQGYCRVAQLVDYVGRTPRYYCDCPPYAPNYQWNQCVPMAAYGKK